MSGLLIVIGIRTKSVNRYDFVPTMFLAPFFSVIYIYLYVYPMLHSSSWLCSQEDGDWSKELIDLCWEFVVNSFPSEDPFCKDSFCLKWGHRIKRKKVVPTTVFFFLTKM